MKLHALLLMLAVPATAWGQDETWPEKMMDFVKPGQYVGFADSAAGQIPFAYETYALQVFPKVSKEQQETIVAPYARRLKEQREAEKEEPLMLLIGIRPHATTQPAADIPTHRVKHIGGNYLALQSLVEPEEVEIVPVSRISLISLRKLADKLPPEPQDFPPPGLPDFPGNLPDPPPSLELEGLELPR